MLFRAEDMSGAVEHWSGDGYRHGVHRPRSSDTPAWRAPFHVRGRILQPSP